MGFFKKELNVENKNAAYEHEVKENVDNLASNQQVNMNISTKRKNLRLFDIKDVKYVIDNFPQMSVEIRNSLDSLADTLENTIDFIEDRSSEVIKNNRDFTLSQAHRDTSIAIYEVVQNIKDYTEWMKEEYEGNLERKDKVIDKSKEVEKIVDKELINEINTSNKEEIEIFNDLSLIEPKGFKLEDNLVRVEDWDDLLVKTAEILTKQYKENKNSRKKLEHFNVIDKKSTQNSFRDTVIEMLNEYKISLNQFKVIV